jgi:hypothetical protein
MRADASAPPAWRRAIRDAADGRPCAAARGRRPRARSRPVRPPPEPPSRGAGGRSSPMTAGPVRRVGRPTAARAGPVVADGCATSRRGRPCGAASAWVSDRPWVWAWRSRLVAWARLAAWAGWRARGIRPSEPSRYRALTPTVVRSRFRSRSRSCARRPAPATGACRCDGVGDGGEERRGLLMGVARSPAHMMAHGRAGRRR